MTNKISSSRDFLVYVHLVTLAHLKRHFNLRVVILGLYDTRAIVLYHVKCEPKWNGAPSRMKSLLN